MVVGFRTTYAITADVVSSIFAWTRYNYMWACKTILTHVLLKCPNQEEKVSGHLYMC
jgi:hypothetical protein